jgi:hypothetical protein
MSPPRAAVLAPRLRLPVLLAGMLIALWLSLATLATPAGAFVEEVGSTKVGLQPREVSHFWEGDRKWNGRGKFEVEANVPAEEFANNPAQPGHPHSVMHSVATYAIYWDPQDFYHGDWQGLIDGFLANMGSAGGQLGNVFAVDTQYTDETDRHATSHSTFLGAYTDTNPYPSSAGCTDPHEWTFGVPVLEGGGPVCLTDAQIRAQLETFIDEQHDIQKGMGTIFYVLTPPGVTVCLDKGREVSTTGHCSDFEGSISEIETDEKTKEEKEAKSEPYTEPEGYKSYKHSFCSYHSVIDPTGNGEDGGSETILYAVIPWTAGGEGDNHLTKAENTPAYDCQDGGFEPGTKPNAELEEKEHEKERTLKEEEEFREKSAKEKREAEEARELGLEAPHEQEPNQLGPTRSPDGSFDTGLADLIINQIAVEQQNTVTDPLLNAWQDPAGEELTDECRNSFYATSGSATANPETRAGTLSNQSLGQGSYYLNDAFNLASQRLPYPGVPCMHGISLEPKFTAPNPVNSGEVVGFDGMESDITLDSAIGFSPSGVPQENYATYTWNFGDGSPEVSGYAPGAPSLNSPADSPCAEPWLTPCAASTFHTYQYGGTYNVTLTVIDVGGNTASITEQITVDGPSRPVPPPPSSGSSSPGGASGGPSPATGSAGGPGSSSSTTGAATPKPPVLGPVASAAVAPSSLAKTTRSGLVVRYSVNQQVTGSFNVLLAASIAHRLGLHSPLAVGLPAGTPPQVVVGKALLITTQGGRGTLKIQFGKITGARLRRLGKVSLMLQLNLRNAAGATTTVLSKIVLR